MLTGSRLLFIEPFQTLNIHSQSLSANLHGTDVCAVYMLRT